MSEEEGNIHSVGQESEDGERDSYKPVIYDEQDKQLDLKRERHEYHSTTHHYSTKRRRRENWHNGKYIAGPAKFDKETTKHVMCCPKCGSNSLTMDVCEISMGHLKHIILETKHSVEYDQQILPPSFGIRVICQRCPPDSRNRAAAFYLNIYQTRQRVEFEWEI